MAEVLGEDEEVRKRNLSVGYEVALRPTSRLATSKVGREDKEVCKIHLSAEIEIAIQHTCFSQDRIDIFGVHNAVAREVQSGRDLLVGSDTCHQIYVRRVEHTVAIEIARYGGRYVNAEVDIVDESPPRAARRAFAVSNKLDLDSVRSLWNPLVTD